jgi:phosphatidylinositol glycan class W
MEAYSSLKEQKEAFVTGHEGTTPLEVFLVCLSAPIGFAFYQSIMTMMTMPRFGFSSVKRWQSILLEALVIWFPMVLCQTNFLYPWAVLILILQGMFVVIMRLFPTTETRTTNDISISAPTIQPKQQRLEYLTLYRSSILYLTFVAILAVDFHVFPRRFAKTEVYGYGLMDVGAASFCFSAGLVSNHARGKTTATATTHLVRRHLWHTLPLLIVGSVRLVTNKGLEYQEHVSEYGVHWNFFFTLGVLAFLAPVVSSIYNSSSPTWSLPCFVLIVYQFALSQFAVQEYIEEAPRICSSTSNAGTLKIRTLCDLFAANREGVLGCLGYMVIFWLGERIGHVFLWNSSPETAKDRTTGTLGGLRLLAFSVFLWLVHFALVDGLGISVSRRSTNASFCVWAVAHNGLLLSMIQLATTMTSTTSTTTLQGQQNHNRLPPPPPPPIVLDTVNRHGLLMFLVANLLTGLVNLSMDTLQKPDSVALGIVFGYICMVGMAALAIDRLLTSSRLVLLLFGQNKQQAAEQQPVKQS